MVQRLDVHYEETPEISTIIYHKVWEMRDDIDHGKARKLWMVPRLPRNKLEVRESNPKPDNLLGPFPTSGGVSAALIRNAFAHP